MGKIKLMSKSVTVLLGVSVLMAANSRTAAREKAASRPAEAENYSSFATQGNAAGLNSGELRVFKRGTRKPYDLVESFF